MFLQLTGKPNLSSMVVAREGYFTESYQTANGVTFPHDVEGFIKVTDRAGAEICVLEGEVNSLFTKMSWLNPPEDLADVEDGMNFEMSLSYNDETYMVRYGRVVRRGAAFPAAPENSQLYTAALYTDSVGERTELGPFWVQKKNKTVMHPNGGKPNGMGNDGRLFDKSAVHWYAPLNSDTQKVRVSIMKIGGGQLCVALCSNYAMTNWIGAKFDTSANTIRPVVGSVDGPIAYVDEGVTVANTIAATPDPYTVSFDFPTNTLSVYKGTNLSPLLTWVDTDGLCAHGDGHRYTGLQYFGALLGFGPQVSYWSAKDDL